MRPIAAIIVVLIFMGVGVSAGVAIGRSDRKVVLQTPAGCNIAASDTIRHLQQMIGSKRDTGITLNTVKADISNLKGACLAH